MDNCERLTRVIDALEVHNVSFMLVGSLSSSYYGYPRATKDADLVVEWGGHRVSEIWAFLGPPFRLKPQVSFETNTGTVRNIIYLDDSSFQIELFRLSVDAHDQERSRRKQRLNAPDLDRMVNLPTAEDVIITKLRWAISSGRGKDRDDARDVLAVQGDALDFVNIENWCGQHGTLELLHEIRCSIPPI